MFTTLTLYLLENLLCSGLLVALYQLFFKKLTHFRLMRYYLLTSLLLPLLLPLTTWISLPFFTKESIAPLSGIGQSFNANIAHWLYELPDAQLAVDQAASQPQFSIVAMVLIGLYLLGVIYFMFALGYQLHRIRQLLVQHKQEKQSGYWLVWLEGDVAPFSFFNYLFLGKSCQKMDREELDKVKQHELVHIKQRHSLDLLLLELINVLCWFNPFHRLLRVHLQDVHEYLADEQVAAKGAWQPYAQLLVEMSRMPLPVSLTTGFTAQQVGRRIRMMGRNRSGRWSLLRFTVILPLLASLAFLFSCLEEVPENYGNVHSEKDVALPTEAGRLKIGQIYWKGNQVFTDAELSEIFGIKSGDPYDSATVAKQLDYDPDRTTISDLYMDQGYLFFSIEVKKQERTDQVVDLRMNIIEGKPNRLGDITVRGNKSMSSEEILREIDMESGELFSRSKLIGAQRAIAELGYFDPQNVRVNPIPKHEDHVVDIEFVLEEINK